MFSFYRTVVLLLIMLNFSVGHANDIGSNIADPTKPSEYRASVVSHADAYQLELILLGRDRKIAIINGHSFSEGDRHKLGKVIEIKSGSVVMQGSKRHVLKLVSQSVKKTVDIK